MALAFGIAGEGVVLTCATALALIFYVLLRPVSRDLALMAVFFNLVSIAIEGVAAVSLAMALAPLADATSSTALRSCCRRRFRASCSRQYSSLR